jgi:hypothetical protein
MNLETQKQHIKDVGISCLGCSDAQIELEASKRDIIIPSIYKAFLSICGQQSGHLFCGCNIQLDSWDYINEAGRQSYKAALGKDCPEYLFFIMEHHGYSYYYFDLREGENPDIYILIHGDEVTNEVLGKLEDILTREIERLKKK